MSELVSVIIPARNEPYLLQTIKDLAQKAKGDVEIIGILEGYWADGISDITDPRISFVHFTEPHGMRGAINAGARVARGKYLMKVDAHVMMKEGYDEVLRKYHQPDWVQVPRRYPLDPEKWEIEERDDNKYPIDEMLLDENLQGKPTRTRFKDPVTDLQTAQGSCWFMEKEYFNHLELEDEETYGNFWNEFQEIGFKVWLSGGRVVRNIETWYAHWHKTEGRGYSMGGSQKEKAREMVSKWQDQKMFKHQIHDFDYMIDRFK